MVKGYRRRQLLVYASTALGSSFFLKACTSPAPIASPSAGSPSPSAKGFKVAIVLPGPITDKSWNQAGYESMAIVKAKLGAETAYVEKVAQADQAESLSDFARRGFNLIIAHGGQFEAAVKQVAAQFPNAFFVISDGVATGSNIASVQVNHLQIAYLCGIVAAEMSKTNKVAFLTAQSFTTTDQERRGFELGAKAVKPAIAVKASYTNDWNDVSKAKEATQALLASGVDVVYNMLDEAAAGVIETLADRQAYAIGYFKDQLSRAPKTVLTSAVQNYGLAIETIAEIAQKGQIKGEIYTLGLDQPDILRLGEFSAIVPEATKQKAIQARGALATQKIAFENCTISSKPSWCVKGAKTS
ncbi:MAG: BMP family protein [Lyngbya sp. HA4199-MV5]|jgi:basic membrane protein A|nr:BMP family protein [Lyngbya sp. HA4199-MV5]